MQPHNLLPFPRPRQRRVRDSGRRREPIDNHGNQAGIVAVAEQAYARMQRTGTNQAVVMSGESGAGKTETYADLGPQTSG